MISDRHRKLLIDNSRLALTMPEKKHEKFSVRYASRSNTKQLKITLKGASARSKTVVSLSKTPWDEQT